MRSLFAIFLLFIGQMRTLQDKPVVHLHPNQDYIPTDFGGDLVELVDTPPIIQLPRYPPKPDAHGHQWAIDVANRGTGPVTLVGNAQFTVHLNVGRTVTIKSIGSGYSVVQ
jgi:hypothetical protein